jgi:hypothetical protein
VRFRQCAIAVLGVVAVCYLGSVNAPLIAVVGVTALVGVYLIHERRDA